MRLIFKKPQTLRELLAEYHVGKPKIHNLYMEKRVLVNNTLGDFYKTYNIGDIVDIDVSEVNDIKESKKDINVIYEDQYLLIVNKEANLLIHGEDDSLINRVSHYFNKNNINTLPRFANRIDKDTTGLVIFTKDFITEAKLDFMIKNNLVDKYYLAVIKGNPLQKGEIVKKIGRHRSENKMVISKTGDYAKTMYEVVDGIYQKTLVLVKLETGRTHQIRVHFESIKCPLYGDKLYGGDLTEIKRQALHSYKLEFLHPITNEKLYIRCEMPDDMKKLTEEFKRI